MNKKKPLKQNKKKIGRHRHGLAYFKKAVTRAKRDSWHNFVESVSTQTPTARLVKVIRRNKTVRVSSVIKHNREFTKSPLETLNYLLDILSPGSQQTENHATGYDLVDNPFMRPEGTEMIANICLFKRMEAAINQFQPFKAPGPDVLYPVPVTERLESTERILPCHFSSGPETQLCAVGMERRHIYISSQTQKGKLFRSQILPYDQFNFFPTEMVGKTNSVSY